MKNVCVIGIGTVGVRHLQALCSVPEPLKIFAIDTNPSAWEQAKKICQENLDNTGNELVFLDSIRSLPRELELAVIATMSGVRRNITEELLRDCEVRYLILEKVLFQRLEDYDFVGELLEKSGVKAYVNHIRRLFPVYRRLREAIKEAAYINFSLSASNWGMGCNSLHWLDMVSYLAGNKDIVIRTDMLDADVIASKREGYREITGCLTGHMGICRNFAITSFRTGKAEGLTIIDSDVMKCVIEEHIRKAKFAFFEDDWKWKEEDFELYFISQTTAMVAQELFTKGTCGLTEYPEAAVCHRALLKSLIPFFEARGGVKGLCPIT